MTDPGSADIGTANPEVVLIRSRLPHTQTSLRRRLLRIAIVGVVVVVGTVAVLALLHALVPPQLPSYPRIGFP